MKNHELRKGFFNLDWVTLTFCALPRDIMILCNVWLLLRSFFSFGRYEGRARMGGGIGGRRAFLFLAAVTFGIGRAGGFRMELRSFTKLRKSLNVVQICDI